MNAPVLMAKKFASESDSVSLRIESSLLLLGSPKILAGLVADEKPERRARSAPATGFRPRGRRRARRSFSRRRGSGSGGAWPDAGRLALQSPRPRSARPARASSQRAGFRALGGPRRPRVPDARRDLFGPARRPARAGKSRSREGLLSDRDARALGAAARGRR